MNKLNKEAWAAYITALEKRLAAAKKIGEILEEHPELAADLVQSFLQQPAPAPVSPSQPNVPSPTPSKVVTPRPATSGETLREKIIQWFRMTDNEPIGAPRLAEVLLTERGSVTNVLYYD